MNKVGLTDFDNVKVWNKAKKTYNSTYLYL